MSRDTHRILPHEDGWQVKRDGGQRASRVADTKAEAEKLGRTISEHQETEFIVHGRDGAMQRADSHGNDSKAPG